MKAEIKCLICGKAVIVAKWRIGRAKYCGYPCAIKGRTSEKSYDKPRKCVSCKNKFIPTQRMFY